MFSETRTTTINNAIVTTITNYQSFYVAGRWRGWLFLWAARLLRIERVA